MLAVRSFRTTRGAHEAGWNVAPAYQGRRGHPVLLDRAFWAAMLEFPLMGNRAMWSRGRREKLRLVDVMDKGVLMDIDTRESYQRALGRGG